MSWQFERVAGPVGFTEGPVWDGAAVLFCAPRDDQILRFDPATGACAVHHTGTLGAGGLARDRQGRLYACQGRGRRVVRYDPDGSVAVLADRFAGKRLNSPNDLVVDSRGRVWFTDPCYQLDRGHLELDHESVYRLDPRPDGRYAITRVVFDILRPNGLAFSPDEQILYVAESPRFMAEQRAEGVPQLRAYPVRADGSLGPMRVVYDFGDQRGIDGLRVDAAGNVVATCGWQRSGPGPRIAVFAPDGTVLEEHPTPAAPTNLVFGGPELSDVYVTGFDGALWRARTGRRGLLRW
jgi:gluconolactonase